ncbi:MAG: TonB-dependent receptor, partial [Gammaproteobacteria bacterium]|nr:TonB-dependent receptor [Gammaproteobacteria bacterium]
LGLRTTYFDLNKRVYVSPRLQVAYSLDERWKLKGSWSRYHQFLRQISYEDRFGRTQDFWTLADDEAFPIAHSKQLMLGFNFLNDFLEVDVELYEKNTDGVIAYALTAPGFEDDDDDDEDTPTPPRSIADYAVFEGTGISRGIDFLLKPSDYDESHGLRYGTD